MRESELLARAIVAMLKKDCNARGVNDPGRICTSNTHRLARTALDEYEKAQMAA